mmetsp:Transcript_36811/g.91654  ORF Transcript_36811/g.91654 Transcript_36811/m.91654 type:complete len:213 (-) Transcript_36811:401-1039(-)
MSCAAASSMTATAHPAAGATMAASSGGVTKAATVMRRVTAPSHVVRAPRTLAFAAMTGLSNRSTAPAGASVGSSTTTTGIHIQTRRQGAATAGDARRRVVARAADKDPSEAEDVPPWERREIEKKAAMEKGGLPWPAYLGIAVIIAIASIGSCFELAYGNAIFGVVDQDSFAYKPILYWFIGTGFPLTAYLWIKGIAGANEAAELQDKLDGY